MSTGILKSKFGADQHPDENQLLLALERELPPGEIAAVEQHIGTCWACRARYNEMHRGILAFVEYRDKVYLPELERAPGEFRQFPSLLNKAVAESRKAGLLERLGARIRSFFTFSQLSLQTRWVIGTAAVMTIVLLWTQVLSPTTLSASELLTRAAEAQNPPAGARRQVRQKVHVKSGKTETVREFQWETGSPIPGAKWGTDPENWAAPMTAEGFSQWHDSLAAAEDKVKKAGDRWTLDTVAPASPIAGHIQEASIVIRTGDFHPIEQHIHFTDGRSVDLEEVSFDVDVADQTPRISTPAQVLPAAPSVTTQSPTAASLPSVVPAVNLDEAELELRYAMFVQRLDDDEDLQISRTADAVIVSGVSSSEERLRQLKNALGGLMGVRLSVSAPGLIAAGTAPAPSQKEANGPSVPLLKDRLDSAFASVAGRRDFVDSSLSISDFVLSHAWALKKLADRYGDADRHALKPESQAKLNEMLRGHLEQLGAANAKLSQLLDLLPVSQPPRTETPAGWRPGVAALFGFVQQQDALVAAMVAGTQNNYSLAAASDRFRSTHEAIARLAGELKPPDDGAAPR